jgi:hypothetical protein
MSGMYLIAEQIDIARFENNKSAICILQSAIKTGVIQ